MKGREEKIKSKIQKKNREGRRKEKSEKKNKKIGENNKRRGIYWET